MKSSERLGVFALAGLVLLAVSQELLRRPADPPSPGSPSAFLPVPVPALVAVASPRPPLGLPTVHPPDDNPYSPEKAELGKLLFFDTRLSSDGSVSCASCHDPAKAFTDGRPTPLGIGGARGLRNVPTILNRAYSSAQFWDGRSPSLEDQVFGPVTNPLEMTTDPTPESALRHALDRLKSIPGYVDMFRRVFGTADFSFDHVAKAIAAFERTVFSGNSPFDRFQAGDGSALTPGQARGMDLFFNKASCHQCHLASVYVDDRFYEHDERSLSDRRVVNTPSTGLEVVQVRGFNFTDGSFQNTGVGAGDPGRFSVTRDEKDRGAFKTPTLRDVEHTAPYMHDGSLATLEDVVDYYDRGGNTHPLLSPGVRPLGLSPGEKSDLVAFLKSLSGDGRRPTRPPEDLPR